MCGVTGLLRDPVSTLSTAIIAKMVETVRHRGPDDGGIQFLTTNDAGGWRPCSASTADWRIALGTRRLSILDVSDAGHMPMSYRDAFWITYNGEIYNYLELRSELQRLGHTFHSTSDTEVILAAYAEWGVECFQRFRGMWGLLIVDCMRNEAILCRDRSGIKPLYYWHKAGMFAVVSEIKQLDRAMAVEYLRTGYELPQRSFFQEVQVVPAGHWMRIPLTTLLPSACEAYWWPERIQVAVTDREEASRLFADKLRESVYLHMRSDVPVGCALSGGLDSSSIAMLVDEQKKGNPLSTFTVAFPGSKLNEQEYVDAVTATIAAIPHAITPRAEDFIEELPHFLYMHDEPMGSLSIYAGYCVARLTRKMGIPVTLNGQGGDEILSGYWQSYFLHLRRLLQKRQIGPLSAHFTGTLLKDGNPELLRQVPVMLRRYNARSKAENLFRLRPILSEETHTVMKKILLLDEQSWRVEEIRSLYLPRLLKWDDRNSMAFSVEGRYPFLDAELIELCLSFAPALMYRYGWTKWPLRHGLRNILPAKILRRRTKLGFEVPQSQWLCGPLRPTLERWLQRDRPLWQYVEHADVYTLAERFWRTQGRNAEHGQALFRLFVFDKWMEVFRVNAS